MSTTSVPSVADIIESFPHVPVRIQGTPTYATLKNLRKTLKANASSVPSIHGGGNHGHLGLVVPAAVYNTIVIPPPAGGDSWVDPVPPHLVPAYPPNAGPQEIEDIQANHREMKYHYRLSNNVNKALRKQLLASIDPIYLRPLDDINAGFSNAHTRVLLHYLFHHYGQISPQDLVKNDIEFKKAWDPTTPFEHLINQIENTQEFALDAGQPYTPAQILNNAYTLVFNTGVYIEDCNQWDLVLPQLQTWFNFKTHFLEAQRKFRLKQSAHKAGYFGMVLDERLNEHLKMVEEAANSMITASTAATSAREEDMSTLSATHAAYTATTTQLSDMIKQLQAEVASLKSEKSNNKKKIRVLKDQGGYCWSHGYCVHPDHTSKTCKKRKPGHQEEATRENNMGGSQFGNPQADH